MVSSRPCAGSAVAGHRSAAESRHDRSRDTTTQKVLTATVEDQVPVALIATAPLSPLRTPLSGLQPSATTSMAAMSAAAQHQVDRLAATAAVARKLGRATKGDAGMARPALRAASQPLPVPQPKAEVAYEGDGEVAAIYEDELHLNRARPSYWETVRHRHLDNVALSRSLRCAAVEAVGLTSGVADLDGGGGRTFGDSELRSSQRWRRCSMVRWSQCRCPHRCHRREWRCPDAAVSAGDGLRHAAASRLQLASNGLTDCGADSVASPRSAAACSPIQAPGLSGNQLQLHKCPSLPALREPSATAALTDLDLSINRVHDRGAVAVFGALGAASLLRSARCASTQTASATTVCVPSHRPCFAARCPRSLCSTSRAIASRTAVSTLVRTACSAAAASAPRLPRRE